MEKNVDNGKKMNLTPGKAQKVCAPIIEKARVNIECQSYRSQGTGFSLYVSGRGFGCGCRSILSE